jgi:cell division protein FtsI (penicillin-binding protein 3)
MGRTPSLRSHRNRRLSVVGRRRPPIRVVRPETSAVRLMLVWVVLAVATAGLALNLFRLQVTQSADLKERASQQQLAVVKPFMPRRQIVDRMGTVLAIDRPVFTLFVHPKLFNKLTKEEVAVKLAPILNRPATDLVSMFNQRETGIKLASGLQENQVDRIEDLRIDGLETIPSQERFYPQQELVADVVGYVNQENNGQAGIELSQQNLLERPAKDVKLRRAGDGSIIPDQLPGGFLNVDDFQMRLTIDTRLQRLALAALKRQVKQFSAKRGTVLVMDVQTGALLTLVTDPAYDPNQYFKYPLERFKNWALTDLYEPGSTFKPINVAIALQTGAIKPNSILTDEGQIKIGDATIQNYDFRTAGGRGPISIAEIVKYSSNVGMVHVVQQIAPATYYNWLKKLGLGDITHIDLPSETPGQFKDRKTFLDIPIERATAAFGQGFSLTPVQLAQLHAALANGGRLVTPHVVRGLIDSKGQVYWQPNLTNPRQIFSKTTTQTVLTMMEGVVKGGTGKSAQIEGYRIGGKTGTAQKAAPGGGYYENAKITSFVGIFPLDAPRYVVVAVVDEPQGGDAFGSTVAAPIVKEVMQGLITLERIPPSQTGAKQG